jgi:hypothetical protein
MDEWQILERAWTLGLAGALVSCVAVVSVALIGISKKGVGTLRQVTLRQVTKGLPAAAEWKFSDSWAANITGLTAAAAAVVVAVSDKLEGLITKEQAAAFAVTTAGLTVITALGPMVYEIFLNGKDPGAPTGTWYGLLAAAFMTLTGAFGTLGAISGVISFQARQGAPAGADLVPRTVDGGLRFVFWAVAGILLLYAVRTLTRVMRWAASGAKATTALSGIVSRSCCGAEAATYRVTLP